MLTAKIRRYLKYVLPNLKNVSAIKISLYEDDKPFKMFSYISDNCSSIIKMDDFEKNIKLIGNDGIDSITIYCEFESEINLLDEYLEKLINNIKKEYIEYCDLKLKIEKQKEKWEKNIEEKIQIV